MAININTASRNALLDGYLANFDGGVIEIYSGTQPATANDAASGTVLATINLPVSGAFTAAGTPGGNPDGVASLSASVQDTSADATGTATWCRIYDTTPGSATLIIDGDVSTSGAFLNLDNTAIQLGGQVTITSMTLTHPA